MKLNEWPQITEGPFLIVKIIELFRDVNKKVNALASGSFGATDGVGTAAPTTGTWARGDYIKNSAPSEAGGAGSKYVIHGWICTVAGAPGTWLQDRRLTGN